MGECRRHTPVIIEAFINDKEKPTDMGFWPTTQNTDWCGEHPGYNAKSFAEEGK
jgi:hypothetical protein